MPIAAGLYRLRGLHGNANWAFYRPALTPAYSDSTDTAEGSSPQVEAAAAAAAPSAAAASSRENGVAKLYATKEAATCCSGGAANASLPAAAAAGVPREDDLCPAPAREKPEAAPAGEAAATATAVAAAVAAPDIAVPAPDIAVAAGEAAAVVGEGVAARSEDAERCVSDDRIPTAQLTFSAPQQQRERQQQQQEHQRQQRARCGGFVVPEKESCVSDSSKLLQEDSAAALTTDISAPRQLLVAFPGDISDFFVFPHPSGAVQQQPQQHQSPQRRPPQQQWHQTQPQQQQHQQQGQNGKQRRQEEQEEEEEEQQQHVSERQQGENVWTEKTKKGQEQEEIFGCSHYPYSLEGLFWILSSRFPTHAMLLVRPAAVVGHHAVYRHFMPCDPDGTPYSIEEALAFTPREASSIVSTTGEGSSNEGDTSSLSSCWRRRWSKSEGTHKKPGDSSTPPSRGLPRKAQECSEMRLHLPEQQLPQQQLPQQQLPQQQLPQQQLPQQEHLQQEHLQQQLLQQEHLQQQLQQQQLSLSGVTGISAAARGDSSKEKRHLQGEKEAVMEGDNQMPVASVVTEYGNELARLQQQQQEDCEEAHEGRAEEEEAAGVAAVGDDAASSSATSDKRSEACDDPFSATQHLICLLNSLGQQLRVSQQQQQSQEVLLQLQHRGTRQVKTQQKQQRQQQWQQERSEQTLQEQREQQMRLRQQPRDQDMQQDELVGDVKTQQEQQLPQEEENKQHSTPCQTVIRSLRDRDPRLMKASSNKADAAVCCCGVALDSWWEDTSFTLLGFSKGAAVVLSCLRSKCRCWQGAAARRAAVSCSSNDWYTFGRSSDAADAAVAAVPDPCGSPSPSSSLTRRFQVKEEPVSALAAEEAVGSSSISSSSKPARLRAVVGGGSSTEAAAIHDDSSTGSVLWNRDRYAASCSATTAHSAAGYVSTCPGAAAATPAPRDVFCAGIEGDCCRGRSTAACPALSSFWRRVHILHIVDGGLPVPHVLYEISLSQLLARFQATIPTISSPSCAAVTSSTTTTTGPSLFCSAPAPVCGYSAAAILLPSAQQQQQKQQHDHQQLPLCACSGFNQTICSTCCFCCKSLSPTSSITNSCMGASTTGSSTNGSMCKASASSSTDCSSVNNSETSIGISSNFTSSVNNSISKSSCRIVLSSEEADTCAGRDSCGLKGQTEKGREEVKPRAASRHRLRQAINPHEGHKIEERACSVPEHACLMSEGVVKESSMKRTSSVTQQNREAQRSEVELSGGLKEIWVHCSSRQLFDGRRPYLKGETLGFLRALLQAAAICDASSREMPPTLSDIKDCRNHFTRPSSTALTTVGLARYYMPAYQRRLLSVGRHHDSGFAATSEALVENTTEGRIPKQFLPSTCHREWVGEVQSSEATHENTEPQGITSQLNLQGCKAAAAIRAQTSLAGAPIASSARYLEVFNYQQAREAQQEAEAELYSRRVAVDLNFGLDVHFNLLSDAILALRLSSNKRRCSVNSRTTAAAVSSNIAVDCEGANGGDKVGNSKSASIRGAPSSICKPPCSGASERHEKHVSSDVPYIHIAAGNYLSSTEGTRSDVFSSIGAMNELMCGYQTAAHATEIRSTGLYESKWCIKSEQRFGNGRIVEVDVPVPQSLFFEKWRHLSGTHFFEHL